MLELFIFAGVNGAGKSTFYINQLEGGGIYGLRINSDEIVREFGNWSDESDQNRAARLAITLRREYMQRSLSFNIESTLSGKSIINFIKQAKQNGYKITLFYVGLESLQLCKQRVAIRVAKRGHNIASHILERRFNASFDNLVLAYNLCDIIYFYDNSQMIANEKEQKFANLTLVAIKENNELKRYTNKNISWFENVLSKVKNEPK